MVCESESFIQLKLGFRAFEVFSFQIFVFWDGVSSGDRAPSQTVLYLRTSRVSGRGFVVVVARLGGERQDGRRL